MVENKVSAVRAFRDRLASHARCVGPSITCADPMLTEAIAPVADFLWIDTEHSPISIETLSGHLLAARACDRAALVRVESSATGTIKRILDAGVDGIIIPQVRGFDEAAGAVADCRYPPLGRRGFGPRRGMDYGRKALSDFLEEAETELFVALMLEHVDAVNEIDAIVDIPGLDSVVVGPMDLSASLGHLGELKHPAVVEGIETIIAAAHRKNLHVGMGMGANREFALHWLERGVDWVQLGCDFEYMVQGVTKLFGSVR